ILDMSQTCEMEKIPKRFKVLSLRELGKTERDTISKDYKKVNRHFKVLTLHELGKTERDTISKDFEKLKTSEISEEVNSFSKTLDHLTLPPYFTSTSSQQNFDSTRIAKQPPLYYVNQVSTSSVYHQPITPQLSEYSWHDRSSSNSEKEFIHLPNGMPSIDCTSSPQSITSIKEYDGLNINISDLIWTSDVSKNAENTSDVSLCKLQEYMLKQSIKNLHIAVKSTIAAYNDLKNCFLPGEKLKVDPPPSEIDPKLWSELLELLSNCYSSDENIKCLNAYNSQ
ncbi:12239_t:CDS:2, partial [Acaulospora morrowiae]